MSYSAAYSLDYATNNIVIPILNPSNTANGVTLTTGVTLVSYFSPNKRKNCHFNMEKNRNLTIKRRRGPP